VAVRVLQSSLVVARLGGRFGVAIGTAVGRAKAMDEVELEAAGEGGGEVDDRDTWRCVREVAR
jgi:hypothetical protein